MKTKVKACVRGFLLSELAMDNILGHQVSWKKIKAEHFFIIVLGLLESAKSILGETICTEGINDLLFNCVLNNSSVEVRTKGWQLFCAGRPDFFNDKFAILRRISLPRKKGFFSNEAILLLQENGDLFLVDCYRLAKIKGESSLAVKEFHVISYQKEPYSFKNEFYSLAKKYPSFCRDIVYYGMDKLLLHIGEKEKQYLELMKFKRMMGKISFSDF